jgi:hypothetical protein
MFWRSVSKVGALLHAGDDERRQTKRNSLVETVEARPLADLKIERAAVESERRMIEATGPGSGSASPQT